MTNKQTFDEYIHNLSHSRIANESISSIENIFFRVLMIRHSLNFRRHNLEEINNYIEFKFNINKPEGEYISDLKYSVELILDPYFRTYGWVYGNAIFYFQSIIDSYLKFVLYLHIENDIHTDSAITVEELNGNRGSFQDLFRKAFQSKLSEFHFLKEMHILYEKRHSITHNEGVKSKNLKAVEKQYGVQELTEYEARFMDHKNMVSSCFNEVLEFRNKCKDFIISVDEALDIKLHSNE